jgi:pimeloyl-ACP methyl ester carboxylesterase
MNRFLRTQPRQMLKSWYALFFQLPYLPEILLRLNHWHFLMAAMPKSLTQAERQRYRDAWDQPGAMTAMLNWYRSSLRLSGNQFDSTAIQVPTLILWGRQDRYLSYEMAQASLLLCEKGNLVTFEDSSHWVLQDQAQAVSQRLAAFFGSQEY